MKKLLILIIIPFLSFGQLTYIPDDTFEQLLINVGYDDVMDNWVLTSNINTVSTVYISSSYIEIDGNIDFWDGGNIPPIFNLTGIQDFALLQDLNCQSQYLSELNLSGMFYLQNVYVTGNYISCVNISSCPSLYTLHIDNNFLTQIDISENISLEWFKADANPLLQCVQYDPGNIPGYFWVGQAIGSEDCGYTEILDCSSNVSIVENMNVRSLVTKTDLLGRKTTNKGFQLHIYDDGSVEKKYLIK